MNPTSTTEITDELRAGGTPRPFRWHLSAPPGVDGATCPAENPSAWSAWQTHLRTRKRPIEAHRLLPEGKTPLAWGILDAGEPCDDSVSGTALAAGDSQVDHGSFVWLRQLSRLARGKAASKKSGDALHWVKHWLAEVVGLGQGPRYAIECLAWAYALPRLATQIPGDLWWELLGHLLDAASSPRLQDPLTDLLQGGELPLILAYLFPEIENCRELAPAAGETLSTGFDTLLDDAGLPRAPHLEILQPLFACWTRCRAIREGMQTPVWSAAAESKYEWLVRQAVRLTRGDRRAMFVEPGDERAACFASRELFDAALRLGGDRDDPTIVALALKSHRSRPAGGTNGQKKKGRKLPDAAVHSEEAEVAVLRDDWTAKSPLLVIRHDRPELHCEFHLHQTCVLSGPWNCDVRFDGQGLAFVEPWELVCWISDDDGSFLELATELSDGVRIQRQVYLARKDRFLFVADAVLGPRSGKLEYRLRLPLAAGVAAAPASKTSELILTYGKHQIQVIPLSLGEWRSDRRFGTLAVGDPAGSPAEANSTLGTRPGNALEFTRQAEGQALYAALWIDLSTKRTRLPLTWRHLTVAQQRTVLGRDIAAGYRLKCGGEQWLVYRSLAPAANRTVLGKNLISDFLLARFGIDGETESLVEIEEETT